MLLKVYFRLGPFVLFFSLFSAVPFRGLFRLGPLQYSQEAVSLSSEVTVNDQNGKELELVLCDKAAELAWLHPKCEWEKGFEKIK